MFDHRSLALKRSPGSASRSCVVFLTRVRCFPRQFSHVMSTSRKRRPWLPSTRMSRPCALCPVSCLTALLPNGPALTPPSTSQRRPLRQVSGRAPRVRQRDRFDLKRAHVARGPLCRASSLPPLPAISIVFEHPSLNLFVLQEELKAIDTKQMKAAKARSGKTSTAMAQFKAAQISPSFLLSPPCACHLNPLCLVSFGQTRTSSSTA